MPEVHLVLAIISSVMMFSVLVYFVFWGKTGLRIRGAAVALLLLFFLSAFLGVSVLVETMPPLLHGIFMGVTGLCCLLLSLDLLPSKFKGGSA